MSSTITEYVEELEGLRYTDEEKQALVRRLEVACAAAELDRPVFVLVEGNAENVAGEEHWASVEAPRSRRGRSRNRWRTRITRVAAALVVASALGFGTASAYAAGTLDGVLGLIDDVFNGAPAKVEVVDKVGYPLGASATSDGITVTADAVVGDRHMYTVIFTIEKEDGTAFEDVPELQDGRLGLWFTDGSYLKVDGAGSTVGGAYFYDADPTDNAIQYACQLQSAQEGVDSLTGRTVRVHLQDLSTIADGLGSSKISDGVWNIKFELGYEDASVDILDGEQAEVACGDTTATLDEISVSPVGISICATEGLGTSLPVSICLEDGSMLDVDYWSSTSSESWTVLSSFFDRIIDVDDILYVIVGDAKFYPGGE